MRQSGILGGREAEEILKYQNLALKISWMLNTKTRVNPIEIGTLGAESLLIYTFVS